MPQNQLIQGGTIEFTSLTRALELLGSLNSTFVGVGSCHVELGDPKMIAQHGSIPDSYIVTGRVVSVKKPVSWTPQRSMP